MSAPTRSKLAIVTLLWMFDLACSSHGVAPAADAGNRDGVSGSLNDGSADVLSDAESLPASPDARRDGVSGSLNDGSADVLSDAESLPANPDARRDGVPGSLNDGSAEVLSDAESLPSNPDTRASDASGRDAVPGLQSDGPAGPDVGPTPADADARADSPDAGTPQSFAGGVVTTNWLHGAEDVARILRQPGGKVVVVGRNGYTSDLLFARFLATGAPDTGFGKGGFSGPYIESVHFAGYITMGAAALQSDGKILSAVEAGTTGMALLRLDASGVLDRSFGASGVVTPKIFMAPQDMLVQSDGKIVVIGETGHNSSIVRFLSDGTLDPSFGKNGYGDRVAGAVAVALDANGRFLVAGTGTSDVPVARFTSTGQLDTSFGTGGIASAAPAASGPGSCIAIQPDGKIVVGTSLITAVPTNYLVRFTDRGVLDTTFGGTGALAVSAWFSSLAIQADGKILAGTTMPSVKTGALRVTADGGIDQGFGQDGFAAVTANIVRALAVGNDGSVLAAGGFLATDPVAILTWLGVAKLSASGSLDASFGDKGVASSHGISGPDSVARSMALAPDGRILIAGGQREGAVVRFQPDGALDTTFGSVEPGRVPLARLSLGNQSARSVAVDGAGRILLAGDSALVRLRADGTEDQTFSRGLSPFSKQRAIALAADGSVVLAGQKYANGSKAALSAEAGAGGKVVPTTYVLGTHGESATTSIANALVVLADGGVVAAGSASYADSGSGAARTTDLALFKTTASLALDPSFGAKGATTAHVTAATVEEARALAIQSDGKLVLAGYACDTAIDFDAVTKPGPGAKVLVARFTADGALDTSFATAGVFADVLGSEGADAFGVAIDAVGRILVAGRRARSGQEEGVVVRLSSTGQLDTSFAKDGIYTLPWADASSLLTIAVEPSGGILAAGRAWSGLGSFDMALVRIVP